MSVLIVARAGCFHSDNGKYASAALYAAGSDELAFRFCEVWNADELERAQNEGGYPGEAFVVEKPLSALDWVVDRYLAHAEEVSA